MTFHDLTTRPTSEQFRDGVVAVVDALATESLVPSVMTCAFGREISVITNPLPTWDAALRIFAELKADEAPGLGRHAGLGSIRAVGAVPALGLHKLSLAIDL